MKKTQTDDSQVKPLQADQHQTGKTSFIDASRRGFFQRSAVAGGVAIGAIAPLQSQAEPTAQATKTAPEQHAGYQLTDKVREYYRKARF